MGVILNLSRGGKKRKIMIIHGRVNNTKGGRGVGGREE